MNTLGLTGMHLWRNANSNNASIYYDTSTFTTITLLKDGSVYRFSQYDGLFIGNGDRVESTSWEYTDDPFMLPGFYVLYNDSVVYVEAIQGVEDLSGDGSVLAVHMVVANVIAERIYAYEFTEQRDDYAKNPQYIYVGHVGSLFDNSATKEYVDNAIGNAIGGSY